MYTTHGLHIPGTQKTSPKPEVVECRGFVGCAKCIGQFYHAIRVKESNDNQIIKVSFMDDVAPELKARVLVGQYYNDRREDVNEQPEITLKEIHIRTFDMHLRGWKAIIDTDIPDGRIYEVVFRAPAKQLSITVYQKVDRVNYSM